jgi:hypothetical protein
MMTFGEKVGAFVLAVFGGVVGISLGRGLSRQLAGRGFDTIDRNSDLGKTLVPAGATPPGGVQFLVAPGSSVVVAMKATGDTANKTTFVTKWVVKSISRRGGYNSILTVVQPGPGTGSNVPKLGAFRELFANDILAVASDAPDKSASLGGEV